MNQQTCATLVPGGEDMLVRRGVRVVMKSISFPSALKKVSLTIAGTLLTLKEPKRFARARIILNFCKEVHKQKKRTEK
jgi:hypothetical protein